MKLITLYVPDPCTHMDESFAGYARCHIHFNTVQLYNNNVGQHRTNGLALVWWVACDFAAAVAHHQQFRIHAGKVF